MKCSSFPPGVALLAAGLFSTSALAEPADSSKAPDAGDISRTAESLNIGENQREKLLAALKQLHSPQSGDPAVWPENLSKALAGPEGVDAVRRTLASHGFLGEETQWLEKFPADMPPDVRTSVIVLHARQLLREGPPRLQNHWPEWNKGDKPGTDPEQVKKAAAALLEIAGSSDGNIEALLSNFVPKNVVYQPLHQQFVEMERDMEKLRADFIPIPPIKDDDEVVKPGDRYAGASVLARRLIEEGYLPSEPAATHPDGTPAAPDIYTLEMAEAVKAYQERHGRTADGIIGPNTLAELNRNPDQERELLRINLHRARLLPDEPGERYLIVNVPSTSLAAFQQSDAPVFQMKTIVGESVRKRRTPIFRDVMEKVEFRPHWNVPPEIAKKEIVPKALKDHDYLSQNDYEIVSDYQASKVLPASGGNISEAGSGGLNIRQRPGPKNSLGNVKFLFPNEHDVYLHDTPKDQLFAQAERDFSHGCIRLEKPAELAEFVLGPQGWSRQRIDQAMEAAEPEVVKIENPVNVYIVYFTALPTWDEKDGRKIRFHPDLYEQDNELLGLKKSRSTKADDG